jgi:hypothetical protein
VNDLLAELFARPATDPVRQRLLPCPADDAVSNACARDILTELARGAFRRSATAGELDELMQLMQASRAEVTTDSEALRIAMSGVLLSPTFLFRLEFDADPLSPAPHPISDVELATRLSYFVWGSAPDAALLAEAEAGRLSSSPGALEAQVQRMLAESVKVNGGLVQSFGGQWLLTRQLEGADPNSMLYPSFTPSLRAAMTAESEMFFADAIASGLAPDALLRADFTYANEELAAHYSLPGVSGAQLLRVPTNGVSRGGALTQGAFLTATSMPERTSPVRRGAAVLGQLFCTEPPPPPDNVESFMAPKPGEAATVRQRLEAHRASPECAACHALFDGLGFGLENYDGIGAWRTTENGVSLDATGTMPGGQTFSGVDEMVALLAQDERFLPCVVRQLLTFGTGRTFENPADAPQIASIVAKARASGGEFSAFVRAVAESEPFQTRRGGPN